MLASTIGYVSGADDVERLLENALDPCAMLESILRQRDESLRR